MNPDTKLDRAEGMFLGAAAGDALGWPQELRGGLVGGKDARQSRQPAPHYDSWVRRSGSRYEGFYLDQVNAGEYSDDTQLMCAVARSYLSGDSWTDWFGSVELPTWLVYQRGGGRAVLAAARSWAERRHPWVDTGSVRSAAKVRDFRQAGGNGAAMRVAPHVLATEGEHDLIQNVLLDASTTHGHPRALIGALVYALALQESFKASETVEYGQLLRAARRGLIEPYRARDILGSYIGFEYDGFEEEWHRVLLETVSLLDLADDAIRHNSLVDDDLVLERLGILGKDGGAGNRTAVAAIYIASRGAARPSSALLSAAFMSEADTDTVGSMVGGILGAIHGTSWLKDLLAVQDATYIRDLAAAMIRREVRRKPWSAREVIASSKFLREHILNVDVGESGVFPDGRSFVVRDRGLLEPGDVVRSLLELEDGQTLYVDKRTSKVNSKNYLRNQLAHEAAPEVGVRVWLGSADLSATARFYSIVTGREIRVQGSEVHLSSHVVFRESRRPLFVGAQEIDLVSSAPVLSMKQLGFESDPISGPDWLVGEDPDGRTVRVQWQ